MESILSRFMSDYGMVLALLVLCIFFSFVTWDEQHPVGIPGGSEVAETIVNRFGPQANILVVTGNAPEDIEFSAALRERLNDTNTRIQDVVNGSPGDARKALQQARSSQVALDAIACTQVTSNWKVLEGVETKFPGIGSPVLIGPKSYYWPNFLKAGNLLNIANQISVIAIIAIGMTMVIISAGIDLSVGSLIALSAVVTALSIHRTGALSASTMAMIAGCALGILAAASVGLFSGIMVTAFRIPPFIVTLAMMLVASGLAYIISDGQSIYELPESFVWLGRGEDLGIPNAVVLTVLLYVLAHIVMTQTALGRYIYAVGGNREAARLSGVPVKRVLLFVYMACGALAGLGGVVMASQLKSGAPTYGQMYELYVIAAVVVGGTSLAGGEGKVFGTLVGALIIAVIQNGMNLTNVESYTQKVVLGLVILGAVLLDTLKRRRWTLFDGGRSHS